MLRTWTPTRKPKPGARPNFSHVLARDLWAFWLLNEGNGAKPRGWYRRGGYSAETLASALWVSGTTNVQGDAGGPGVKFAAASSNLITNSRLIRMTGDHWVLAWEMDLPNSAGPYVVFGSSGDTYDYISFRPGANTVPCSDDAFNGPTFSVSSALQTGRHRWAIVRDGAGAGTKMYLYRDGVLLDTQTDAGTNFVFATFATAGHFDQFGRASATTFPFDGTIYWFGAWQFTPTSAWVKSLHQNPWAMFDQPTTLHVDAAAAAPGGVTIPVFRHHYVMQGAA